MMDRNLIELRKYLHTHPELSGSEEHTSDTIGAFLQENTKCRIIRDIGGHGVAAIFQGKMPGKIVMFRADTDALPIRETTNAEYASQTDGVAHSCGHDGHMSILAGLAMELTNHPPKNGTVVLLFQPAEETGAGASAVINDPKFRELAPNYVFGLHNIPGFPLHSIIVRDGAFSSASRGMIIRLTGKTAHASAPELGINPAFAIADLIHQLKRLPDKNGLVTIIFALLGERALGTSPAHGELIATLRTFANADMDRLVDQAETAVANRAQEECLTYSISYQEEFPATTNDNECVDIVGSAARMNELTVHRIEEPFRWSEDFAHFTNTYRGALFGLGAGEAHPGLHSSDYDFPDQIIDTGVAIFSCIHRIIENLS